MVTLCCAAKLINIEHLATQCAMKTALLTNELEGNFNDGVFITTTCFGGVLISLVTTVVSGLVAFIPCVM